MHRDELRDFEPRGVHRHDHRIVPVTSRPSTGLSIGFRRHTGVVERAP
jgi:hypothetical protein